MPDEEYKAMQRRQLGIKQRDYEADEQARQRLIFWVSAVAILVGLAGFTYWAFT